MLTQSAELGVTMNAPTSPMATWRGPESVGPASYTEVPTLFALTV